MWYSVGATYKVTPNLSIDAGFAHLRGKKIHFTESQSIGDLADSNSEIIRLKQVLTFTV